MLNRRQLEIKQRLVKFDREKDNAKQMALYAEIMADAVSRGENFAFKVVPHGYEEKMKQKMFSSEICFIEFPSEVDGKVYKTIAVQEKDADAFLKIQESVFNNQSMKNREGISISDVDKNAEYDCEEEIDI